MNSLISEMLSTSDLLGAPQDFLPSRVFANPTGINTIRLLESIVFMSISPIVRLPHVTQNKQQSIK